MTCDEAYAAVRHLSSVLGFPSHGKAHMELLRYFHKSFIDYLSDFSRSGFSPDIKREADQLFIQCTFRILEQAPDGIDVGNLNYEVHGILVAGTLVRGPGTGDGISLAWPVDEGNGWDDNRTRLFIYKMAFTRVMDGIALRQQAFCTVSCIRLFAIRLRSLTGFANIKLHDLLFEHSRRHESLQRGLLQKIPVKMLNVLDIMFHTMASFHFRRPATPNSNLPNPWNPSCIHERKGEWEEGKDQAWSTSFNLDRHTPPLCDFCYRRCKDQLESWQTRFSDHPVLVLFTSTGRCLVEFQFVDPEDGVSEWTYWIVHSFSEKKRRELGSTV